MNFRRPQLLLAAAVGVMLLAAWWWPRSHGPTYQGRDVQGWLKCWEHELHATGPGGTNNQAESEVLAAFRRMGPDAIPPLVETALAFPSASLKERLLDWMNYSPAQDAQLPPEIRARLASGDLHEFAASALHSMHLPASLLFPPVTNRLKGLDGKAKLTAMGLLLSVSDDRKSVAQGLIPLLISEPVLTRDLLSELGPVAVVALPELATSLNSTNHQARLETVHCLSFIGLGASNALPTVRELFDAEPDLASRFDIAIDALDIGASSFWAEDEIHRALVGTDRVLRLEVVGFLSTRTAIAPRFGQELADLARGDLADRKSGSSVYDSLASRAIDILYHSKFDRTAMTRLLNDCLQSTNLYVRINVTNKLVEMEAGADSARRPFRY